MEAVTSFLLNVAERHEKASCRVVPVLSTKNIGFDVIPQTGLKALIDLRVPLGSEIRSFVS